MIAPISGLALVLRHLCALSAAFIPLSAEFSSFFLGLAIPEIHKAGA
jgi:hypothetical protein